jgi:hypothetical protein
VAHALRKSDWLKPVAAVKEVRSEPRKKAKAG